MLRAIHHTVLVGLLSLLPLVTAPLTAAAAPLGTEDGWLSDTAKELRSEAERAIILGGAILYRYRHTIAGMTLGCTAGAIVGATGGVAAGLATSGTTLPGTGPATAIGCALGAAAGAQLGLPLDQPMD
ncbi:MAG TPA: hypothetical protein VD978_15425 [Azospirillum sp.]|nr:hypothetical protein [Azospirillum sp.]